MRFVPLIALALVSSIPAAHADLPELPSFKISSPQGNPLRVHGSSAEVMRALLGYSCYKLSSGHKYDFAGWSATLNLFGSAVSWVKRPAKGDLATTTGLVADAYVRLNLQPADLSSADSSIFPNLTLRCTTSRDSKIHFNQHCDLAALPSNFAVDQFKADVDVNEVSNGDSEIQYTITMHSPRAQLEAIKGKILANHPNYPKPIVDKLVDSGKIFTGFFAGFYEGWVADLQNGRAYDPWTSCSK